ncbi:MAG: ACT domain-containing protein [Clostridia bacterium]|nr:ACT domain-containing protein [Clostridia bacterium]MDR3643740.1 ACT domain-containing protein [Clostridia bacterium]
MSGNPRYLLVESDAAPEVFLKVLEAKNLLASGRARSVNEATRQAELSRSAYYKYKDKVHSFAETGGKVVTLNALLRDEAGILSKLTRLLYRCGANILTINQNMPASGVAPVCVTARVEALRMPMDEMLKKLSALDGVESIEEINGY